MKKEFGPQPTRNSLKNPNRQPADSIKLVDKIESELVENPALLEHLLVRPKVMAMVKHTSFSGPLPPPSLLREYKELIDNGAERIMTMAESEQSQRHRLTELTISDTIRKEARGQWMAFIIAIIILAIAVFFAWRGETSFAAAMVSIDLIAITAIFALGRHLRKITPKVEE